MSSELVIGVEAHAYNATIRNRRRTLELTQRQLAELAGVPVHIVCNLELFRRVAVGPKEAKVLRVLGLDESASPPWLAALELHGKRTIERSVTAELAAKPELLALPVPDRSADPFAGDPSETLVDEISARKQLGLVLNALPPRERVVLELRFGFADGEERTLDDIGKMLDVTRERVRQLEQNALNRIRGMIAPEFLAQLKAEQKAQLEATRAARIAA